MSSTNENKQPEQILTTTPADKQYIETTMDGNGKEQYRLCNYGFVPNDANDRRYCTVKGFNQKILDLLASLAEDDEEDSEES
jgi:hypothetical protein